jgi:hypothetical protein
MRKMLPEGAVRQKMSGDGFTPQEIENFFGVRGGDTVAVANNVLTTPPKPAAPAIELPPEGMSAKPKIKPNVKLKGLFWTKIKPDAIEETVWHRLPDFQLSSKEVSQLEEWFSTKGPAENASTKKAESKTDDATPKLISILDGKRTQSVLILLGKLRVAPEELVKKVQSLDSILDQELTSAIMEVVPTTEGDPMTVFLPLDCIYCI